MSLIASLTLSDRAKGAVGSTVDRFRSRMGGRINEQIEIAKADAEGKPYAKMADRWVEKEDGGKILTQVTLKARRWFWRAADGKWCLQLKTRSTPMAIAPGKTTVEVGTLDEVVAAFETLRHAVLAGELDEFAESGSFGRPTVKKDGKQPKAKKA